MTRRLGIVGCGAVTRLFHAPASLLVPGAELAAVADANPDAARALAAAYTVPVATADYRDLIGRVDLAVVATPPQTHVDVVTALLSAGLPVLCEKPLGRTADECATMRAATSGGATLFAAHNRRHFPNRQLLRSLLHLGAVGELRRISLEAGGAFHWPTVTGYQFERGAGGGVLLDSGIHELDTLLWYWPDLRLECYRDDALGGVESNCELHFTVEGGVPGTLRLSRTSPLANTLRVEGSAGVAELVTYDTNTLQLRVTGAPLTGSPLHLRSERPMGLLETFAAQLTGAFLSLEGARAPVATVEDALRVARIVDACYEQKRGRPLPVTAPLSGMPV